MDTFTKKEKKISSEFLNKGYYIFNIKEKNILNSLSSKIIYKSSKILNKKLKKNFLYQTHNYINNKDLNNYRLKIYNYINKDRNFYYHITKWVKNI